MGEQSDYLKELGTTLLNCSKKKLLCDLVIITEGNQEVFTHSVILAAVSSKLRAAFAHFGGTKRNSMFRLSLTDCSLLTVETVIQFIYTGSMSVPGVIQLDDINKFLLTGQKLGLDPSKLGQCLSALISFTDPSYFHFIPPFVINDEDIYLELIEKDSLPAVIAIATEIIKLTSKVSPNQKMASDHSYTPHYTDNRSSLLCCDDDGAERVASDSLTREEEDLDFEETVAMVADQLNDTVVDNRKESLFSTDHLHHHHHHHDETDVDGVAAVDSSFIQTLNQVNDGDEMKMLTTIFNEEQISESTKIKTEEKEHILTSEEKRNGKKSIDSDSVDVVISCVASDDVKPIVKAGRGKRRIFGGTKHRVLLFCDICSKTFMRSKEYVEHHRIHTGEKPYTCDLCGKSFGRRRTMIEHRRLHTGERPFLCDICDKRFSTSGELVKHRRFHTGEKPYQCNVCGKKFSRCGENADHRRIHAGENVCPICGKEFTRQHNMKEHLNSAHTGQRRYVCITCGKCFAYSSGLRYHRRLHKIERPFICQLCNKSFARGGELSRHERNAHKSQIVEIQVYA